MATFLDRRVVAWLSCLLSYALGCAAGAATAGAPRPPTEPAAAPAPPAPPATGGGDVEAAEPAAAPIVPAPPPPAVAIVGVWLETEAALETWQAGFQAAEAKRREAGLLEHLVAVADGRTLVYLGATDLAAIDRYLAAAGRPAALDASRALRVRHVQWRPAPAGAAGLATCRLRVADFARWKRAYDAAAEARRGAGVVGERISQGADDGRQVLVELRASDAAALAGGLEGPAGRGALGGEELRGAPVIRLATIAGEERYR